MNPGHEITRIEKRPFDAGSLPNRRRGLSPFDYLVLAGGFVNLCVIGGIVGFWLAGL